MPYYARKYQLQESLVYHVYNRSNARMCIFNSDADYCYLIKLLIDYSLRFGVKIYHWVIMSNHYHLLLEMAEPENISKFMAGLNRSYTYYYHKNYSSVGFLWQGRFKLQPVQREQYLIACARYIERNPIKAGIISKAQDYLYSSAKFYCEAKMDSLTTESPEYDRFGNEVESRREAYKKFLLNFDMQTEKLFSTLENPAGTQDFIKKLIKVNGRYMPRRQGRPMK